MNSSTCALLQRVGHWAHHIRSKSASENDTGGWGQKRGWTSSACSDGTTAGVVSFRSTRSLGARLNATSDYPLHHSRCSKLTKSIDEVIGLQAKRDDFLWNKVYWEVKFNNQSTKSLIVRTLPCVDWL